MLARYDHLFRGAGTYNGTISDIGDVVGGATPSKKRPEYYCHEGIGWITPKDLSNTTNKFVAHGADDITRVGFDSCSIKKLPAGTVLFSSRAPIGYIAIASDEVTTNQGFKSIVPHKEIGTAFVYCFLVRNKDRIADAGSGTTFPEVSGKTMAGIELTLPNINLCAKFEEWASPLLEEQRHLEDENRQLEDLRDTLLPKLMSGEIDVSKVDLTQLTNNHLSGCGSFCSVCCPSGLASEFHEWFREHFFFGYGHLCKADLG
ncbi:restriction endonuclease subunit S [Bifidobacterium pseudocatenulatum]|uniref:restriction endonuclease subunit S n=1 Tax=Bifidobacterium pseudocatenulatum TaxID=28026 RepID=UPI001CFA1C57|nr:restriction endonuclease subunit S [Bifidobacterium pseudocatenulatum]UDG87183.1 restriction endonuclease subunit S [Bifidobacterium pseudocatenulatum]